MPGDKLSRTLSLRTAANVNDFGSLRTLETLVRSIHRSFTTVATRRSRHEGMVIECRHADEKDHGLLLHLVGYTPDDPISVVPKVSGGARTADLDLLKAPEDAEFLDGDLMLFIRDDEVAVCRSGLAERSFSAYVVDLAAKCGIDPSNSGFELMKRADIDKMALIRREGIKSVSLSGVAHAASAERAERGSIRRTLVNSALEEIRALLGVAEDIPPDAENLKVEVLFTFDKRRGTTIDQRQLNALARAMMAETDGDGFTIETLSGKKVRADDIVISKPVKLSPFGKSVDYREAWQELRQFHAELTRPRRARR